MVRAGNTFTRVWVGALCMVLLGACAPAFASKHVHAAGCPDLTIIGARGSGEPATRATHGMGPSVWYMATRLRDEGRSQGDVVGVLPVVYRASGVELLAPSKGEIATALVSPAAAAAHWYAHHFRRYIASIDEGISQTVLEATTVESNCPDTDLVLAGYSQGAMVIHQAELRLNAADPDVADAIIGTLLLADGDRVPGSQAHKVGSAPDRAAGVRVFLHATAARDVFDPETTANICDRGDAVCDFSFKTLRHAHRSVDTHTSYLDRRSLLDEAVDWLANDIYGEAGTMRVVAVRAAAHRATLATFAGTWYGHTRGLVITRHGRAKESIDDGCCNPIVDLTLRLSHARGTRSNATVRARVTSVHVHDRSAFTRSNPPPRVGERRRLRLRHGVIKEPITRTNYCSYKADLRGTCGA